MDWREAKRIGDVELGHRQLEPISLGQMHNLKPRSNFSEEMGEPADGGTPPDVDDPLAKHCRVDQRLAPKRLGNNRPLAREGTQGLVPDEPNGTPRERRHVVIHDVEMQAL